MYLMQFYIFVIAKSNSHINPVLEVFLSSSVVKTLCFHCLGCEFDPWLGN